MTKKMIALVKYSNKDKAVRLMDVDIPKINSDEVLIEIKYAGICGSDPHIYHQNISYNIKTPIILGHEYSGKIVEIGENISKWKVGDRVTSETHADYCNECVLCRMGYYHLCKHRKGYGFHVDGVFTKYVKVKQRILHSLPENVSYREGSAVEPLCVVYNAIVNNANFMPGYSVIVIGPGTIGMLAAMLIDIMGASKIVIAGTKLDKDRLEKAKTIGPFDIILSEDKDSLKRLKNDINEGYGFDLVIDSAGSSETLKLAMEIVRPYGEIVKIGWGPQQINYSIDEIIGKSVRLQGSFSHFWPVWERCLELLKNKKIDLNKIITHEMPLDEWKQGFDLVGNCKGLKVVFKI